MSLKISKGKKMKGKTKKKKCSQTSICFIRIIRMLYQSWVKKILLSYIKTAHRQYCYYLDWYLYNLLIKAPFMFSYGWTIAEKFIQQIQPKKKQKGEFGSRPNATSFLPCQEILTYILCEFLFQWPWGGCASDSEWVFC